MVEMALMDKQHVLEMTLVDKQHLVAVHLAEELFDGIR